MKKSCCLFALPIVVSLQLFKIVYDRKTHFFNEEYCEHYCGNVLASWAKNLQLSALNQKAFIQVETSFVLLQLVGHE